ncbi:MarR family transcriptional regulator [Paraburkholderia sp. J63]|uniref:MarR family transcriptional regulator n=1 Tax=Paraburkholderia sp. J63 TaxID=2805434 RepID=UPI002ABD5F0D|nr:MarR family transcriptional regulator [Paraburkholderia sp. J63]
MQTLQPIDESLALLLARARESLMMPLRPLLRDADLTEQQWRVLRTVGARSEMDLTEIAVATSLLPASLTRIVRDLTDRKLVARREQQRKQRFAPIYLTRDGHELIERITPDIIEINEQIIDLYGEQRIANLMKLLREFREAISSQFSQD